MLKLLDVYERKMYLESLIEMDEKQRAEYLCVMEEWHRLQNQKPKNPLILHICETDSSIVASEVETADKRKCKFCGKEEFLFSGVDFSSMANYGCCRNCFYLFVE